LRQFCINDTAMGAIVTERLHLRPMEMRDAEAFAAYRADPEVARYQGWDAGFSLADAERLIAGQAGRELGDPGGWLQIAVSDRETGALLGDCAVHIEDRVAEVGVTFAPGSQGRGLATEALSALVTRLFDVHGLHRVHAVADDRNTAVHRLLERLGFRCEARLVEAEWFEGEWITLRTYAVLRREWESRAGTSSSGPGASSSPAAGPPG
jgi:RimJ/RimL family protein N-acetyltransferase